MSWVYRINRKGNYDVGWIWNDSFKVQKEYATEETAEKAVYHLNGGTGKPKLPPFITLVDESGQHRCINALRINEITTRSKNASDPARIEIAYEDELIVVEYSYSDLLDILSQYGVEFIDLIG